MEYIYKNQGKQNGYKKIISPENSELKYIEFGLLTLSDIGDAYEGRTKEVEIAINILGGKCNLNMTSSENGDVEFIQIGNRKNPFDGPLTAIYIPINTTFKIISLTKNFEAAMYTSPTTFQGKPKVVRHDEVKTDKTGCLNWTRNVTSGLGENVEAGRLLIGETLNPSGNWSSYPPHKHDELALPAEAPYEEVYYFKFKPDAGFCMIRLYTNKDDAEPFDKAYAVEDGDAIAIPKGYHPMTVAPGYQMCYLFALAGQSGRMYGAWSDDPKHSWVKNCEAIVKGSSV